MPVCLLIPTSFWSLWDPSCELGSVSFELTVLTQEPERHRIWLRIVPVSRSPMRTADIARLCLQPKVRASTFRCVLPFGYCDMDDVMKQFVTAHLLYGMAYRLAPQAEKARLATCRHGHLWHHTQCATYHSRSQSFTRVISVWRLWIKHSGGTLAYRSLVCL
jgi:hypothetical protein